MSGPIVYVDTSEIREGKREQLKLERLRQKAQDLEERLCSHTSATKASLGAVGEPD